MHPPTMQRRLSEEGTTFEAIKDEARRDLAQRYLSQPDVPLTRWLPCSTTASNPPWVVAVGAGSIPHLGPSATAFRQLPWRAPDLIAGIRTNVTEPGPEPFRANPGTAPWR